MRASLPALVLFAGFPALVSLAASPPEGQKDAPVVAPREGREETIPLFNGKDLSGWEGHPHLWSVKDGTIVARNTGEIKVSTYLLTLRNFSDFRLLCKVKLVESEMHSGIAFWGRNAPEHGDRYTYAGHLVMFPSDWGMYDLFGRNGLPVDGKPAKAVGKQHDWNDLEILAQGNRVRVVVNGRLVVDWRDPEPERIREGPVGLQLHSNKVPQEVHFKDLLLTAFPKEDLLTVALASSGPKVEPLWPRGAPGAVGEEEADRPSLTVHLPRDPGGAAVVVCPGGGYGSLAMDHEGRDVARWLNSSGVAAFVLKYRIAPRYRHPAPLKDAQRALRMVRARAAEWRVDPSRVGILGFSAGGHLASSAGVQFDDGDRDAADPVEKVSSRPDFMVLVYPVISFTAPWTHQGSRKNLLGDDASPALADLLSSEKQVTARTPPAFLIHAGGDTGVPPENSVSFYLALRAAGVPAELHIYEQGGHGFGLAPRDPILSTWPDRLLAWMESRGLLKGSKA